MARQTNRLTVRQVQAATEAGRYADGGGLYLQIKNGGRSWLFIYRDRKSRKLREMGLGSVRDVSLAHARERAGAARKALAEGCDPFKARDEAEDDAKAPTFGEVAEAVITSLEKGWRNAKHRAQWRATLATHSAPLMTMPIDAIETEHVLAVLQPIWTARAETASRLRGRIEKVLDAAKVQGHRSGENPARWRGHLAHILPPRQRMQRGHHAAMPYAEVPAFLARLRERPSMAALALEFTILTASRTGETLGARWAEIDTAAKVWTVPAARMKAGREHRVPLTDRGLEILAEVGKLRSGQPDGFIFVGQKLTEPLSDMALLMLLRRMKLTVTTHGFRSAFRDWADEMTPFPSDLAEAALAHVVGDKVERAYRRGDALEKRRQLMQSWAAFCKPSADESNIVPLRGAR